MHQMRLITHGSSEYQEMVALRDEILLRPLGLHFAEKYLQQETGDILIGCFELSTDLTGLPLIGCCILTPIDGELVQLRQMAVRKELQRSGIGRELMEFAETKARDQAFQTLMMHARKTAVPFYERLGYLVAGEEFLEVGIPHLEMRKLLGSS